MNAKAGIKAKEGGKSILRCEGNQNDTVSECPVANHTKKDFVVGV